jgi:putative methionine-R-sulfoxide reductase with GAF domain
LSLTLARVVERICPLTDADGAAIALRDERGVVCRASQGDAPAVGSVLEPGSGLTGQCFEAAQVVVCDDAEKDSRVQLSIARSLRLRSALAVPIQGPCSVLGVVELLSSRPSAFDMTHVAALERVAGALAHLLAPAPPQLEERAKFPDWLPKRKAIWILISVLLLALLLLLFGALRRGSTHSSAPAL